jgi:hypothetical protein
MTAKKHQLPPVRSVVTVVNFVPPGRNSEQAFAICRKVRAEIDGKSPRSRREWNVPIEPTEQGYLP